MGVRQARQHVNEQLDLPVPEVLASGDFVVDNEPPSGVTVLSIRMPVEWSMEIAAEVSRRGLEDPGQLITALVREGLDHTASGQVNDPRISEALHHLEAVRRALLEHGRTSSEVS